MSGVDLEIVLNRAAGVSIRDQLVAQLELRILTGSVALGRRLPSVRALARRLSIHPNTVSAAYRYLESLGHVELRRGSGVYVREAGPTSIEAARDVDEMIRIALLAAFAKGFTGLEIRRAVERWLSAAPPDRVVVVDPSGEMAALMAHEVGPLLDRRIESCGLADVRAEPARLSGALVVCLPYHVRTLRQISPGCAVETVTLEVASRERDAIASLPEGAVVLVVSCATEVAPFARRLLGSLRGDAVHVQAHPLAEARAWRRLASSADLVMADALAVAVVRRARPRRLHEFRLVSPASAAKLRAALSVVVPGNGAPPNDAASGGCG